AYAAKDPSVVYAGVEVLKPAAKEGTPPRRSEVWRSGDGGRSYERKASRGANDQPANWTYYPEINFSTGWYANVVWARDPTHPDFVVVGSIDLWRSSDGGDTLEQMSEWRATNRDRRGLPTSPHADHHTVVAHPHFDGRFNKTVFFGNDGGVFVTDDVYRV